MGAVQARDPEEGQERGLQADVTVTKTQKHIVRSVFRSLSILSWINPTVTHSIICTEKHAICLFEKKVEIILLHAWDSYSTMTYNNNLQLSNHSDKGEHSLRYTGTLWSCIKVRRFRNKQYFWTFTITNSYTNRYGRVFYNAGRWPYIKAFFERFNNYRPVVVKTRYTGYLLIFINSSGQHVIHR